MLVGKLLIVGLTLWSFPDSVRTRNPILLMIVALPMILGLLPRNWLYGVRTRYSMSSRGVVPPERDRRHCASPLGLVWLVMVIR